MINAVGTGFLAMVLEDRIPFQIDDAGYVGWDYVRDFVDFKFVEAMVVARRLGDYLVCAHVRSGTTPHAVHQIDVSAVHRLCKICQFCGEYGERLGPN